MQISIAITAIICLYAVSVSCLPQGQGVTPGAPGYTQLGVEQIRYLQNKGFGATHKTFRPTVRKLKLSCGNTIITN